MSTVASPKPRKFGFGLARAIRFEWIESSQIRQQDLFLRSDPDRTHEH
jgi:hypothetical protein